MPRFRAIHESPLHQYYTIMRNYTSSVKIYGYLPPSRGRLCRERTASLSKGRGTTAGGGGIRVAFYGRSKPLPYNIAPRSIRKLHKKRTVHKDGSLKFLN